MSKESPRTARSLCDAGMRTRTGCVKDSNVAGGFAIRPLAARPDRCVSLASTFYSQTLPCQRCQPCRQTRNVCTAGCVQRALNSFPCSRQPYAAGSYKFARAWPSPDVFPSWHADNSNATLVLHERYGGKYSSWRGPSEHARTVHQCKYAASPRTEVWTIKKPAPCSRTWPAKHTMCPTTVGSSPAFTRRAKWLML